MKSWKRCPEKCEAVFRETTRPPKSLLSRSLTPLIDVAAHHHFAVGFRVGRLLERLLAGRDARRAQLRAQICRDARHVGNRGEFRGGRRCRLDKPSIPVRLRRSLRGAGSDHPADRAAPVRSRSCRRRCIRRPSSRDRRKRLEFRNSAARRVQPNDRSSSRRRFAWVHSDRTNGRARPRLAPARLPIGKYRPSHIRTQKYGPPPA